MTESVLVEIIRSCLELDRMAEDAYLRLFVAGGDPELTAFWQTMAAEEKSHVAFWEALLDFARGGRLPMLFGEPLAVLDSLAETAREVRGLLSVADHQRDPAQNLVLCCRLEIALMHPAFETLFRFVEQARLPLPLANPADGYDRHISRVIEALDRFGSSAPEARLIGELLGRLREKSLALVAGAHTDAVTGALNRQGFFSVIDPLVFLAARDSQPLGLVLLDLDGFGQINLAHGRRLGDKVLASVAGSLREALGERDILGRLGSDRFAVFLPGRAPAGLEQVALRLVRAVEQAPHHGVSVTARAAAGAVTPSGMAGLERALRELERRLGSDRR